MANINTNLKLTIQFYNSTENPKKIGKDIGSPLLELSCYPYREIDTLNPTLYLKWNEQTLSDLSTYNYFYLVEWDRYYFMKPPVYKSGKVFISGEEDVLMTFQNEILNQDLLVERTSRSGAQFFLADGAVVPYVPTWTYTIDFPECFDEDWLLNEGVLVQTM